MGTLLPRAVGCREHPCPNSRPDAWTRGVTLRLRHLQVGVPGGVGRGVARSCPSRRDGLGAGFPRSRWSVSPPPPLAVPARRLAVLRALGPALSPTGQGPGPALADVQSWPWACQGEARGLWEAARGRGDGTLALWGEQDYLFTGWAPAVHVEVTVAGTGAGSGTRGEGVRSRDESRGFGVGPGPSCCCRHPQAVWPELGAAAPARGGPDAALSQCPGCCDQHFVCVCVF